MLQGVKPGQGLEATVMMVPRAFPALPTLEAVVVHPPRPLRPRFTLPSFFRFQQTFLNAYFSTCYLVHLFCFDLC